MKKIILIFFIFILTGCYDYKEVNELAFVSSIGIDYKDEYILTFEIIDNKKESNSSYIKETHASSIYDAFNSLSLKDSKTPYYYHLKAIVIDKNVAKDHMRELIDYITREVDIRNEFYLLIAKESSKEIINNNKDYIVGDYLYSLIKTNEEEYHITYNKPYEDFFEKLINKRIDTITSEISFDKQINCEGIAVFKNYEYFTTLSKQDSAIFNILANENIKIPMSEIINDKNLAIELYKSNTIYKINKENIDINISIEARITENETSIDLKNEKNYNEIENIFEDILIDQINEFIKFEKEENLDNLGLRDMYYKKHGKNINLKKAIINTNVEISVNKKGLIFEVKDE